MRQKWMRMRKLFAAVLIAGMCTIGAGNLTAFANVDEAAVAAAEAEAQAQAEAQPETQPETQAEAPAETQPESEPVIDRGGNVPFSVPGNGEVLDDISGDSTKEFYTIRTANNNTFYMVIDKSATTENVYMLSMIDEGDLKEFLGETEPETEPAVTPPIVITENTERETESETPDASEENPMKNAGSFAMVGLIAVIGLVAYYILKIRPRKEEDEADSENLEMDDGLEMVDEDAVEDQDSGD